VQGLSSGVIAISAGAGHTCALTIGGGVFCWGVNYSKQRDDGAYETTNSPVAVEGLSSGVTAISTSYAHTCAVTSDYGLFCWGHNGRGQLGDGTGSSSNRPVAVQGLSSGVMAIDAGYVHTCAVMTSGNVHCWGANDSGQLGDGTAWSITPVDVVAINLQTYYLPLLFTSSDKAAP
jgi:alpha-tubulin suppressor-like RCC1 family protein